MEIVIPCELLPSMLWRFPLRACWNPATAVTCYRARRSEQWGVGHHDINGYMLLSPGWATPHRSNSATQANPSVCLSAPFLHAFSPRATLCQGCSYQAVRRPSLESLRTGRRNVLFMKPTIREPEAVSKTLHRGAEALWLHPESAGVVAPEVLSSWCQSTAPPRSPGNVSLHEGPPFSGFFSP